MRELAVGTVLGGKYKLTSILGNGGMGQVFVAENLSIGQHVAIKVLRPEHLANVEFRRRFQKEAEAVAAIEHPNVARFLDLVVGDPTFLVMEYVRGRPLSVVIADEKQLAPARAVGTAIRLAWGLDAAHTAGIVHRDLKPANVILSPDREHGETPKIIDFGLAKLAMAENQSQLTRTGQVVGTPCYMAPEQVTGREIDARTDVYALGCVLYEMITGQPPFVGEDMSVLYKHVHETPPPPSALAKGVPAGLDGVLARALAKAPAERFADMQELATALAPFAGAGEVGRVSAVSAVSAVSESAVASALVRTPHVAPRPARTPWILAGASALVAIAALGLAFRRSGAAPAAGVSAKGAAEGAKAPAPRATDSLLLLSSTPQGATVELDGKPLADRTPTVVIGAGTGDHTLRFTMAGRAPVERRVHLEGAARENLDVAMPAQQREVEVRTVPAGAAIYLDGHLVAATSPVVLKVSPDDFPEVRAEKLGFEPAIKHLTPEDVDPAIVLTLDAEHQPRGELVVMSNAAAQVLVDGRDTGFLAPTVGLRLGVGKHVVQLEDSAGARSKPVTIELRQGETVHLALAIEGGSKP